VIDKTMLRLHN